MRMALIVVAPCAAAMAGDCRTISVAGFGDDAYCSLAPVYDAFLDAGFCLTVFDDVGDIDTADLSLFDVVWLPNGIDAGNESCPGDNPIPSKVGAAALAAFVADGGGLFLCGDRASPGQEAFPLWRDAFIADDLGGGDVDATCDCGLGFTVYLDPNHAINTFPNVIESVDAATVHTPAFESVGHGQGFGYTQSDLTGPPTGVLWDKGSLDLAPDGRLVVWNNSNNLQPFALWAVNAVVFLDGNCPPDCNDDGTLNILDFVCFQAEWQQQTPKGDCDANAAFNILDFVCFQQTFVNGC